MRRIRIRQMTWIRIKVVVLDFLDSVGYELGYILFMYCTLFIQREGRG